MRKAGPILILLIGILALVIVFFPGLTAARLARAPTAPGGRSRPSSASTCRAASASSTRRSRSRARRRPPGDMAIIKDIVERRVNTTGVSEPVVTTQGKRPRRRRAAGRHRPRGRPQARRHDRPPRLRPARDRPRRPRARSSTSKTYPPLFSGDQVAVGDGRHGPERPARGQLRPQGRRQEPVRRLHGRATSASTSRSPSTTAVISAPVIKDSIPNGNVQITGGGLGRLPGEGGRRTSSRS